MENDNYNPTPYTTIVIYGGGMEGTKLGEFGKIWADKNAKALEESLYKDSTPPRQCIGVGKIPTEAFQETFSIQMMRVSLISDRGLMIPLYDINLGRSSKLSILRNYLAMARNVRIRSEGYEK